MTEDYSVTFVASNEGDGYRIKTRNYETWVFCEKTYPLSGERSEKKLRKLIDRAVFQLLERERNAEVRERLAGDGGSGPRA